MDTLFSCFRRPTSNARPQEKPQQPYLQAGGFQNDIVYYKFLNTDRYDLDLRLIQVWVFDKDQVCVHASDNQFKAEYYIGKKIQDVNLQEDLFNTFHDIHKLALTGVESKRTIMINNNLVYLEARTLFYNEDVHDIYGTMLLFIPYANVRPVRHSEESKRPIRSSLDSNLPSQYASRANFQQADLQKRVSFDPASLSTPE
jgi:hypothetical protein